MNCDEAFDWLTDPLRRHRAELRWHLDLCPRCRQMEDVLAPALDLFDEGPPPPGPIAESVMSQAAPETLRLAERTAARLEHSSASGAPERPSRRKAAWIRYAAAFVAGAAVVFGTHRLTRSSSDAARAGFVPGPAADCLWQAGKPNELADARDANAVVTSCLACHRGPALH